MKNILLGLLLLLTSGLFAETIRTPLVALKGATITGNTQCNGNITSTGTITGAIISAYESGGDGIITSWNSSGSTTTYINSNGDTYLNGGNVGIGDTTPDYKLDVVGDINADNSIIASSGTITGLFVASSATITNTANTGSIQNTGTIFSTGAITSNALTTINIANIGSGALNGLILDNPTAGTAGAIPQNSPTLRFSGRYWTGTTSQPFYYSMEAKDNGSGTNTGFRISSSRAGSAPTIIWGLDAAGQYEYAIRRNQFANGTNNTLGLGVYNSSLTAPLQYTPYFSMYGAANAITPAAMQQMVIAEAVRPAEGTLSPIGVKSYYYGINTTTPDPTKELMRFQWGSDAGVTGAIFNELSLANYKFVVKSAVAISTSTIKTKLTINGVVSENSVLLVSTSTITTPTKYINCDTTTTDFTITLDSDLLAFADANFNYEIIIQDIAGIANTNNITIDTEGAETINGVDTLVINSNYGYARLKTNGTNWFIIGS